MARKLTDRQIKFAQLIASGKSNIDSYMEAYDVKEKKPGHNTSASMLLKNRMVADMISELKDPVVHRIGITLENHLLTLQEISDEARAAGHYSAAVAAEVARAKAAGIHIERHENRNLNVNATLSSTEMKEIASKLLNGI